MLNAGGIGEDCEYFKKSKAWNTYDWKLDVTHLEAILNKIKSITKVADRETEVKENPEAGGNNGLKGLNLTIYRVVDEC